MNKELNLNILPDGYLNLEWSESAEEISKDKKIIEEDLYARYKKDYNQFLFYLGLTVIQITLSESLACIRKFLNLFSIKLAMTPDIEYFRENVDISISDEEIKQFLSNSPFI